MPWKNALQLVLGLLCVQNNECCCYGDAGTALGNHYQVLIERTTQSTSSSTGTLIAYGGLGVAKNAYIGGNLNLDGDFAHTSTTESTSSTVGAIITAGGLGVEKNANVGGTLIVAGTAAITGNTAITGTIINTDATESSSSTVGAIITAGGLGVAKNANVGGTLIVTGAVTTSSTVDITGAVTITGALSATAISETSDRRLKNNIGTLADSLSVIRRLRGVRFAWHNSSTQQLPKGKQTGFIAQEVETVLPGSVRTDARGWKSVAYTTIIPYTIEAIKQLTEEQQHVNENLEARIKAQQQLIESLQSQMDALRAAVQSFITI
jgi:hypothetical protein